MDLAKRREQKRLAQRVYYARHRDKINKRDAPRHAAYRAANVGKRSRYNKEWFMNLSPEEKAKRQERNLRWRAANPEKVKALSQRLRLRRRGLTPESFAALLNEQEGRCPICDVGLDSTTVKRVPHIDHDHATGKVRSLLCTLCNLAIGHLKDDPALFLKAHAYLVRHGMRVVAESGSK